MEIVTSTLQENLDLLDSCRDANRPSFHLMPRSGWINDPNGPLFHNGRFHLFYQQLSSGVAWDYGIVWGHATSTDLVHWETLPPAVVPTPGGLDANGCFSGCCVKDIATGMPVLLYTGVRLRSNMDCGPLPPSEFDLNLDFIESQCFAIADPNSEKLSIWHKSEIPFLALPPAGMQLTGWRDPFVLFDQQMEEIKEYRMLIGSGIKGVGGAVLLYKSHSLASGWTYHGLLCVGSIEQSYGMWECPLLVQLKSSARSKPTGLSRLPSFKPELPSVGQSSDEDLWFFCISPDAPNNPVLYWLGDFIGDRFLMESAKGPVRLDLGDILYAPNVLEDDQGRVILWAWLQELPRNQKHDYAGCLTIPRLLTVHNGALHQEPVPELVQLRNPEKSWHIQEFIYLYPDQMTPLEVVDGQHLDLEVRFERGESMAVGILFHSFDKSVGQNGLLVFDWERKALEIIKAMDTSELLESVDKIGGLLEDIRPGDPLELRILIDLSCIEVFVSTGEVLSTRIYRGNSIINSQASIDFVAYGGPAQLSKLSAHEMRSIWDRSQIIKI